VNAGGPAYTDSAGNTWAADTGYVSGFTWTITNPIANTASPALYQTCRYGSSFSYNFAVPNGAYSVNLKFAEVSMMGAGLRRFNVAINGMAVLTNFDIYAATGGLTALDKPFPVTVTNGQIAIQFSQGPANWPMINGIEILGNAQPSTTPGSFGPLRINAGGGAYTDSQGISWVADTGFTGGATWSITNPIAGTPSPALYQTCRYGSSFSYNFAVPNGTYTVKLKFAEVSMTGAGQRMFNVAINGAPVLVNFDIYAATGGLTALDKPFAVPVTAGQIAIQFSKGAANSPMVNGIEILGSGQTSAPSSLALLRVNAGGGAYTDSQGISWGADTGYTGGAIWSVTNPIANTPSSALYQTCRYGSSFSYNFAVPNGTYTVKLKFAEVSMTGAGQRMFNVAINGTPVLINFDIYRQAGGLTALDKSFTVPVTNGQIAIQFSKGAANSPMVNGIEVVGQ
jgi:hypothetical protein